MDSFEKIYSSLNTQQKKAVDCIEGPVMVIAGPGTGKTQILASRIMNILRQQEVAAQNILCLTYTEAGARAMQKRLIGFMGNDAYKVNIHTFHGLCNKIISEYPERFSKRELRVMDDLERIELVQQLIDELPHKSLLKDYSDYLHNNTRNQILSLWRYMKEENKGVDFFKFHIDRFKNDEELLKATFPKELTWSRPPKDSGIKKGDLKEKDVKDWFHSWSQLLEAAELLSKYEELKRAQGVYEFEDMIQWVLRELKNDEEFKMSIQERFQYVLVDEYQDTSGVQNDILKLLIDFWEDNPNCFVVGDDDQSIYSFQGAKVSNMLEFKHRYAENITTIVLTENYRSSSAILKASDSLISNNVLRLVNDDASLSKKLTCGGANAEYPAVEPEIRQFSNQFHEAVGIVQSIEQLIKSNVKPSEIAIIYSKNKFAEEFLPLFNDKKIPFVLSKKVDILTEPIIQLLMNWLDFLLKESENPNSGEYQLYNLLLSEIYGFNPMNLNRIMVNYYDEKRKNANFGLGLREYFEDIAKKESITDAQKLKLLISHTNEWIRIANSETVGSLIGRIYAEGGFVSFASNKQDNGWSMEVLHTFLSFVNAQAERHPFLTLKELLSKLQTMQSQNVPIQMEKRLGNADGVQMVTAHSSKGLEYDYVYIIQSNEKEWEKDSGVAMPYKLRELLEGANIRTDEVQAKELRQEERRRLFFVALTRAKLSATISYASVKVGSSSSNVTPSKFIGESRPEFFQMNLKDEVFDLETLKYAQQRTLQLQNAPTLDIDPKDWLKDRVEQFVFSPSSIKSIIECGIGFYYNNIVRIPSAPNEYTAYGNAIHGTLRVLLEKFVKVDKWPNIGELSDVFMHQMNRYRGGFTQKQFENRLKQGLELLPLILEKKRDEYLTYPQFKTEFSIQANVNGVALKGMIDKVVIDGDRSIIFDYKTGKTKNIEKKSVPNKVVSGKDTKKLPPDYWFQVGIYSLMIKHSTETPWKCNTARIEAMSEDQDRELSVFEIQYGPEDLEFIEYYLKTANEKLKNYSFLTGCGSANCVWCNFSKEQGLVKYIPTQVSNDEESVGELV